jgi:hypothetical protein
MNFRASAETSGTGTATAGAAPGLDVENIVQMPSTIGARIAQRATKYLSSFLGDLGINILDGQSRNAAQL